MKYCLALRKAIDNHRNTQFTQTRKFIHKADGGVDFTVVTEFNLLYFTHLVCCNFLSEQVLFIEFFSSHSASILKFSSEKLMLYFPGQ